MYYCFHGRKDNSLTVAMCLAIFFMANTVTDGQALHVSAFMAGLCDSALGWLCVLLFMTISQWLHLMYHCFHGRHSDSWMVATYITAIIGGTVTA